MKHIAKIIILIALGIMIFQGVIFEPEGQFFIIAILIGLGLYMLNFLKCRINSKRLLIFVYVFQIVVCVTAILLFTLISPNYYIYSLWLPPIFFITPFYIEENSNNEKEHRYKVANKIAFKFRWIHLILSFLLIVLSFYRMYMEIETTAIYIFVFTSIIFGYWRVTKNWKSPVEL